MVAPGHCIPGSPISCQRLEGLVNVQGQGASVVKEKGVVKGLGQCTGMYRGERV